MLAGLYQGVCNRYAGLQRMNFVNAELTKLSVNTYVTTKISYANMLAEICEKLQDADVDVVTAALGIDTRIGGRYLKGALGYGGPCFPRDNLAFAALGRREGVDALLAEATDAVNRRQIVRLAEMVLKHLPEDGRVGVLGLAYKPDTPVVEQSPGLFLAQELVARSIPVVVYDPEGMPAARVVLGDSVVYAASMRECAGQCEVIAITTPWNEFRDLRPDHLNGRAGAVTVIDCWRLLPQERFTATANHLVLGADRRNEKAAAALVETAVPARTSGR
jgi:UDPglucose 6-dehydrogenase